MSRFPVLAALLLVGCGSNWNIGVDDELVVGCLEERTYFLDIDADGWGDPNTDGQLLCEPEGDIIATNQRDCDDDDVTITGQVGAICPAQLVAAPDVEFGAAIAGEGEFVWVHGITPKRSYTEAFDACTKWAQHPYPLNDNTQYGLATFDPSTSALTDVQQAIVESLVDAGGDAYAAWVGVGWEGDLETGAWSWEDDSDDSLIVDIGFCAGVAPRPEDFFPNMYIDEPEHREVILEELERLRLALVLTSAGQWCLGFPQDADPEGSLGYELSQAHMLCERPPADPSEYEAKDGTTTEG